MAPAIVRKIHNVVSKSLQKAVKWGLIKVNPSKDATPPSVQKRPKQIWTVEEAKAFLEVCEQENELVPFMLAIFTGMRRGEILALKMKKCSGKLPIVSITNSGRNGQNHTKKNGWKH